MTRGPRYLPLLVLLVIYGLAMLVGYAALGRDSLGHYVLAPVSAHSLAMNSTILAEVTAAALMLVEVTRLMVGRLRIGRTVG